MFDRVSYRYDGRRFIISRKGVTIARKNRTWLFILFLAVVYVALNGGLHDPSAPNYPADRTNTPHTTEVSHMADTIRESGW